MKNNYIYCLSHKFWELENINGMHVAGSYFKHWMDADWRKTQLRPWPLLATGALIMYIQIACTSLTTKPIFKMWHCVISTCKKGHIKCHISSTNHQILACCVVWFGYIRTLHAHVRVVTRAKNIRNKILLSSYNFLATLTTTSLDNTFNRRN